MRDEAPHAAAVDAWLARAGKGLDSEELLGLFLQAMDCLWSRTVTTLGDVTLGAVAHRVIHDVAQQHPSFYSLSVDTGRGIVCDRQPKDRLPSPMASRAAIRFILVEFLSVLGVMTAELFTKELHEALATVSLRTPSADVKGGKKP